MKKLFKLVDKRINLKNFDIEIHEEQLKACLEMSKEEFESGVKQSNRNKNFLSAVKKVWIEEHFFAIVKELAGIGIRGKCKTMSDIISDATINGFITDGRKEQEVLFKILLGDAK